MATRMRSVIVDKDNLPQSIPLTGRRFNNYAGMRIGVLECLYPVAQPPERLSKGIYWLCKCDCGNYCVLSSDALGNGHDRKSCGCLQYSCNGESTNRIYQAYRDMVRKCTDPTHFSYKSYNFFGITVCEEWLKGGYRVFRDWSLANGYVEDVKGLRLLRKDTKKGFCPDNCYWGIILNKTQRKKMEREQHRAIQR